MDLLEKAKQATAPVGKERGRADPEISRLWPVFLVLVRERGFRQVDALRWMEAQGAFPPDDFDRFHSAFRQRTARLAKTLT